MDRDVTNIDFWKERLRHVRGSPQIHRSVYEVHLAGWQHITKVHKELCDNIIDAHRRVLDAGCGYGRASEWFKDYTGVDFSPDFIEEAKSRYPDKHFEVGDLHNLRFKDQEFDWAVCISIKHMLINDGWDEIEKELKRVAKRILVLEYSNPEVHEIIT